MENKKKLIFSIENQRFIKYYKENITLNMYLIYVISQTMYLRPNIFIEYCFDCFTVFSTPRTIK